MKNLPKFQARHFGYVHKWIAGLLSHDAEGRMTHLVELIAYDDGHYRALFRPAYFGDQPPSKSQWSTLKKRLKRHEPLIFVFKQHGTLGDCVYLDFGFVAPRNILTQR
ncbi:MAG: hypothetical protein HXY40_10685 [Chloroflexi bacterium]|nr:hypothetical protein [Chloroflexota bacterium]